MDVGYNKCAYERFPLLPYTLAVLIDLQDIINQLVFPILYKIAILICKTLSSVNHSSTSCIFLLRGQI